MRRLRLLVSIIVLVDTMLYAALTPLLPHFTDELGLSKTAAGVLVAAYAGGALIGGVPGGLAAVRFGPRRAVVAGLLLMSASSVVFAFADSFSALLVTRLIQGGGSALTWAGAFAWLVAATPRERRGEYLGAALGAAVFGALFGPVIGAAAAIIGRAPAFIAVAVLGALLIVWALEVDTVPGERATLRSLVRGFANSRLLAGMTLMSLPALLFGVLSVLGPLHLDAVGWGAAAIGAVWLVGAAFEAVQAPLVGRLSDRRGRLLPTRVGFLGGTLFSLALAWAHRPLVYVPLIVVASLAYGMLFAPGLVLIADGADDAGMPQGLAFGVMNAAWAIGAVVGPAAGGALGEAAGDRLPFVLSATICASALAFTYVQGRRDASVPAVAARE
jgi:MFS family permease